MSYARGMLCLCLLLPGCAWFEGPRPQWLQVLKTSPPLDANLVQIDAHLIERPLGDPFLDVEVWKQTDQMLTTIQRRETLELNGLRVGQVVGMAPGKLQDLLQSPRWVLDPRRRIIPSGEKVSQILGPVLRDCPLAVYQDKKPIEYRFPEAKFFLDIQASLTADGGTLLKFVPKVETGESVLPYKASSEEGTWKLDLEKPCKLLPELGWEVTLQPNEILLVGATPRRTNSFGNQALVGDEVQRLLVIRTMRAPPEENAPTFEDLARPPSPASLAIHSPVRSTGR